MIKCNWCLKVFKVAGIYGAHGHLANEMHKNQEKVYEKSFLKNYLEKK